MLTIVMYYQNSDGVRTIGSRFADLMKTVQGGLVANALNGVTRQWEVSETPWRTVEADDSQVRCIPMMVDPSQPDVIIEVAMNQRIGSADFYHYLDRLEGALTAENIAWLEGHEDCGAFEKAGFRFAVEWRTQPRAGSVTAFRHRRTTDRFAPEW